MLYRHVFDKISTEFRGTLRVFVNFAAPRPRETSEALFSGFIAMLPSGLRCSVVRTTEVVGSIPFSAP